MKVFISVDMEGITALTDPEDVLPDGMDYARGRMMMTGDANAAILGAFDAGATEVIVNDSHWIMRNLLIEHLDPRAKLIKGFHKPMCMLQGVDETIDAAVFVGYHSCAGTESGVLAHTLLGKEVHNLLLNGQPIGETRLNALLAGHFGVPVAFVAGDDTVCREAKAVLGADLPTYAVKDGHRHVQRGLPPSRGDGCGHPRRALRRPQGHCRARALQAGRRADVRIRVQHDDDCVDLRVHPGCPQVHTAHDRVHDH